MSASWVRQRIAGTQSLPAFPRWIALGIEDDDDEHEDENSAVRNRRRHNGAIPPELDKSRRKDIHRWRKVNRLINPFIEQIRWTPER
jgi:hypothetical protein